MEDCVGSDQSAMALEHMTVCGEDIPNQSKPREPIAPVRTAPFLQSSSASHPPIHPSPSPTSSQHMALAYPALQLFYLLPGNQQGSPPALLPVYSCLPHGQPLYLPAVTCGRAQQTDLEVADPIQKSLGEGTIEKEQSCLGSQLRSKKFRGKFFRPWENACSVTVWSKSEPTVAECPNFRPWEQASRPSLLHKDAEEGVTDMIKGMAIGQ